MNLDATIFAVLVLITPLYAKNYTREEVEETIKKVKIGENAGYQIISILKKQINSEDFSEMSMIIDKADPLMEAVGPAIDIITMLLQNTPLLELKYAIKSFAEMDLKFNHLLFNTFEQVRDFFREEPMKAQFSRYTINIFVLSRILQGFFKGPVDKANFYKRSFMDWYEGVDWQVTEALIEGMRGGSDRSDNIPLAVLIEGMRGGSGRSDNIPLAVLEFTDFNRRQTQHLMAGIIALFMENIKIHLAYHKFKGTGDEHAYKSYYVFMLEKIIHYALKLDREAYGQWHTDLSGVIESKLPSVKGTSNENTAHVLFHFLREKYDWRDWLVVVYDDVFGSEKHWIKVCGGYYRFR
nr:RPT 1 domain containing protein N-U3 isoform 1 [Pinctada fucata]